MRRDIVGAILAGLGVFLIVIAVALPTYVSSRVLKFPLNYYYTATLNSPNTTYFDAATQSEVYGAHVQGIYTLKGDAAAGNSSTAVWDEFTFLHDTATKAQISIQTRKVAFDRKTAALADCCGQNIGGKRVAVSGIAGFVFPIGTKQQTYQVFDATLLKAVPFAYSGTGTVNGVRTYVFEAHVQPTQIGFTPLSSTQPEFYAIDQTYWVDPDTGALLKALQHEQLFLEDPTTGGETTVLFDGTLAPDAASVARIVAINNSGRLKITLINVVIPLVAGIVGLVLLVLGILLARKRRPEVAESGFEAMSRDLTASATNGGDAGHGAAAAGGPAQGKHAAETEKLPSIVPGLDDEAAPPAAEAPGHEDKETGDAPAPG